MISNQKEVLSPIDYNNIFNNEVDGFSIETLEIGEVKFPTGEVVVCDPLVYYDMPPLNKKITPGTYPVKIYIAKDQYQERYAIAKLELSNKKAEKWVLAVRDNQDVSILKENEYYGFPVDAGLGGFFDYATGKEFVSFNDAYRANNPDKNIYDDFFAAEFKKNAKDQDDPNDCGDWINFTIPKTELNLTMFQSGFGDGSYPAYWGMTADNEIVSLVIDFFVIPTEEN